MTTLTGLRALRHLDLDLLRAYQISAGNTKTTTRHLLNRGATVQSIRTDFQAI